jgi:hypothetical protein
VPACLPRVFFTGLRIWPSPAEEAATAPDTYEAERTTVILPILFLIVLLVMRIVTGIAWRLAALIALLVGVLVLLATTPHS